MNGLQVGLVVAITVLTCGATAARGDEILFLNGDRLTGTIVSAADGKLTIQSAVAGTVTVDLAAVKTFSTDKPVELHVGEKNVLSTKVERADADGTVRAVGGDGVAGQSVSLKELRRINPPPLKWTGTVTANATITRGNSNTDNVGISINAERRAEKDRITLNAGYLYGRQEDPTTGDESTTTDNWFLFGKYDYFFSPKFYGFGSSRVERDRIALLDLRFTPAGGVGYQWVEREDFRFSTEAGLAWVYEDFANTDDGNDYFAARLAYRLDKRLNEKVTAFHNLEYIPSIEDLDVFNVNADAGVRASLTARMFAEIKLEWRYDSEPAPGAGKNDLRYLVGVGWTF